ncbi:MAG: ATP-binding protein [Bacteroidia bacterium]|nr:ATP-binding protein [Bacteroidia bacterium]
MIHRMLSDKIRQMATKMPVISITGPRQSGKTVLARELFAELPYVNLENLEQRSFALNDPAGFIRSYAEGAVIDEAQYAPDLFSYIQVRVDETRRNGRFVLTGSQHFQLSAGVSQSLAGRAVNFYLLPFSHSELHTAGWLPEDYEELIVRGYYPRIYDQELEAVDFYPSYIENYVERDARQIINILDLGKFQLFIRLCASLSGQLVNYSALANEVGTDATTIKRWLHLLESSFIIFLLQPYYRNYNKRLVKTPKLYFYDTGLACSLFGIRSAEELQASYRKGAFFENFVIAETYKQFYNRGQRPPCYFWRDNNGNEVDLLIESGGKLFPVEIKSGRTIQNEYFKNIQSFSKISENPEDQGRIVYGGDLKQLRSQGHVYGWRDWQVEH